MKNECPAMEQAFLDARDNSTAISAELRASAPEETRGKSWQYVRERIVHLAQESECIEMSLRCIAQFAEEHMSDQGAIDRLRIIEAKRIKAFESLRKCEIAFYQFAQDMDNDDGQQSLFKEEN